MSETLLSVENLRVAYPARGREPFVAVNGLSFSMAPGEAFGVVGESGSGKSTLGRVILGLEPAYGGRVVFDGRDLATLGRAERRALTREIQVIFQDPNGSLNPARTVGQTLEEPLQVHGHGVAATRRRVAEVLEQVGLSAADAARYPRSFSGGQRQRIAIARALTVKPRLIVCDEPVSALDLSIQAQILNLLGQVRKDTGVAYLFISHDLAVVRHVASRLMVLYRGTMLETGSTAGIYAAPVHPYTQRLLAAMPAPGGSAVLPPPEPGGGSLPPNTRGCVYQHRCRVAVEKCAQDRPLLRPLPGGTWVACHLDAGAGAHDIPDTDTTAKAHR